LNPFHWGFEFYEVFDLEKPKEERGFDVVIGNPPYVRQEALGELKTYFKDQYRVYDGTADLHVYFIERSLASLNENGIFSYIVANKWMRANYGTPLRQWLKQQCIEEIVDFGDLPVFQATTYPCIIRISKNAPNSTFDVTEVKTLKFASLDEYVHEHQFAVNQTGLDESGWSLVEEKTQKLLDKIRQVGVPLGDYAKGKIYRGVLTGLNEAFVIDATTREKLIAEDPKSAELIKPFLVGKDIKRYQPPESTRYLIFTRRGVDIKEYPAIEQHLLQFKDRLMPKPEDLGGGKWPGRKPGDYEWYEIQDTIAYFEEFEKPKIIYPSICKKPEFVFDEDYWYTNQKCFIISKPDKYLLGILNSSLIYFLFKSILPKLRGDFCEPNYVIFKDFPIHTIDFSDPIDKSRHDIMVTLVEHMLELHERLAKPTAESERTSLQQQIDETDRQIDNLVYALYGLTEEEIAIVEEKGPSK